LFSVGSVGKPFPSVKIRIMSEDNKQIIAEGDNKEIIKYGEGAGSLMVKGSSVFQHYLNRVEVTKESFDSEGWFITGWSQLQLLS